MMKISYTVLAALLACAPVSLVASTEIAPADRQSPDRTTAPTSGTEATSEWALSLGVNEPGCGSSALGNSSAAHSWLPCTGPAPAARSQQIAPRAQRTAAAFRRWIDLQAGTISARYRLVETDQRVVTTNQLQSNLTFRLRLKMDGAGRFSIVSGTATGNAFTSGWNNTGIGTGERAAILRVKQLYAAVAPAAGVELQYGGLYVARGENTEITSYDNDGYLTGGRLAVKRPKRLFFDEISITLANLGDLRTPNVFRRFRHADDVNYRQFLLVKRFGKRLSTSADFARATSEDTIRAAATLTAREMRLIHLARVEVYRRDGTHTAHGFAAYGERPLARWSTFGAGFADIDRFHDGLNGDRYVRGRRLFVNGTVTFWSDFTLAAFCTRAVRNDFPVPNRTRFDLVLTYNAASALRRAGSL